MDESLNMLDVCFVCAVVLEIL